MDYGCRHRDGGYSSTLLHAGGHRDRVKCLCMQLYRFKGVALADQKWHAITDAMRVGWEVMPETCQGDFEWQEADFLHDVKVFIRILYLYL